MVNKLNYLLLPTYLYLLVLLFFYYMRDIQPHANLTVLHAFIVVTIMPLILFLWNIQRARAKYRQVSKFLLFLITGLPGLLFGMQFFYGFSETLSGSFTMETLLIMLIAGFLTGFVFGVFGLMVNFILNKL